MKKKSSLAILALLFVGCAPSSRFYQVRDGVLHPKPKNVLLLTAKSDIGLEYRVCCHPGDVGPVTEWGCHIVPAEK